MEMDFEKAFSFITADKYWKKKIAVGGTLSLLSVVLFVFPFIFLFAGARDAFLPLLIICFISNLFLILGLLGYPYIVAYNRINNVDEPLPEWCDFGKLIAAGIKFIIGYLLFSIPLSIAYGIGTSLFATAALISNDSGKAALSVLLFMLIFVIIALTFVYSLISLLMIANFAKDLKVLSFVNFKAAYCLIKNNWANYLILLLLVVAVNIILQLGACVLAITVIGLFFVPTLMFYTSLVTADLVAQFALSKQAE